MGDSQVGLGGLLRSFWVGEGNSRGMAAEVEGLGVLLPRFWVVEGISNSSRAMVVEVPGSLGLWQVVCSAAATNLMDNRNSKAMVVAAQAVWEA